MAVEVRPAAIEDLREIQGMNAALFEWDRARDPNMNFGWPDQEVGESYFRKRIAEAGVCFVAEVNGQLAGYLAGDLRAPEPWRVTRRAEVENMFVKERFRRSGAGSALMNAFLELSRAQGADQALVEAFYGNDSAIDFYESVGFKPHALTLQTDL